MVTITLQRLREIQASVGNARELAVRMEEKAPVRSPEYELAVQFRDAIMDAYVLLENSVKWVSESVELEIEA